MTPAEMYRGVSGVVSAYSYSVAKENLSTRIRQKKREEKERRKRITRRSIKSQLGLVQLQNPTATTTSPYNT